MSFDRSTTRLVGVLLVLGVVAAVAFAPAMATFASDVLAPDEPDADESLVLEPHPGPNGEYAFVNDDGELEIATEEVNPRTDSAIEDVFTITNNASRSVTVNISHDSPDDVVFDSNASSEFGAIQSAEGITIPANGTVAVGFHVDTAGAAAGDTLLETITFHATWAEEDASSSPSSESFSVDTSTPTETPTPTMTATDAEPPGTGEETSTPTPTDATPGETPAGTTETVEEPAGLGGLGLWVLLGLAAGTVAVGYAYRRLA